MSNPTTRDYNLRRCAILELIRMYKWHKSKANAHNLDLFFTHRHRILYDHALDPQPVARA